MPVSIPIYLRPVVGYATFHLRRGRTRSQVKAQLKRHRIYGQFPEHNIDEATEQAVENMVALARLAGPKTGRTFVTAFKGKVEPEDQVGIKMDVMYETEGGFQAHISITVNARADSKPSDVLAFAKDFLESGGLRARFPGKTDPARVILVTIESLTPYSYRSPTLWF